MVINSNIEVSVIIVNYNTSKMVLDAIDSIYKQTTNVEYEIIVVDNYSETNDKETLKDSHQNFKYIELQENIGFGRANNIGINNATGKYIFLLNPDTILVNNAIKILADYLDSNADVAVCGANLYSTDMVPIHSFQRCLPSPICDLNLMLNNVIFKLKYQDSYTHNFTHKPLEVGYITGADMMIRKSVIEKTDAFDPDFFMYYEETELTFRIHKAGYKSVSIPDAKIIHLEGQSIKTSNEREHLKSISKKLYYSKTSSMVLYRLSNFFQWINCILRIVTFFIVGDTQKRIYWSTILKNI